MTLIKANTMSSTSTMLSCSFYAKPQNSLFPAANKSVLKFDVASNNSLRLRAFLSDYPLASRIIVRNLSYSTNEATLHKEFANFGEITEAKIVKDAATKSSKGYAFIQYTSQDDAMRALETMDMTDFEGRRIFVEVAKPGRGDFPGRSKTSGPPKKWQLPDHVEVPDCWY